MIAKRVRRLVGCADRAPATLQLTFEVDLIALAS
jgi:hypothetical protein